MNVFEKLDAGLGAALRAWNEHSAESPSAGIAISLTFTGPIEPIEATGFELHSVFQDQAYGIVKFEDVAALVEQPGVIWLAAGQPARKDLDTAMRDVRVRSTNPIAGTTPVDGLWHADIASGALTNIPKATGKGVIVAILDSGIDYKHPMFIIKGSPDRTRILRIWDQGLKPSSHADCPAVNLLLSNQTYGIEYDSAKIDQALNGGAALAHRDCDGHGTHVAGIAAGGNNFTSVFSNATLVGAAPEADIIAVKVIDNPDQVFFNLPDGSIGPEVAWAVRFKDAIVYCLRTARALGKPVVISVSLGNGGKPGDGLDEEAKFIDGLLDPSKPAGDLNFPRGALMAKSAGNEGNQFWRLTSRIVVPASGEIILPIRLGDARSEGQTRSWINCKRRIYKPDVAIHFWYRRAPAPLSVSFAFRTEAMTSFSAEVMAGGQLELGVQQILGASPNDIAQPTDAKWHRFGITHENTPAAAHPSGAAIQRNYAQLYMKPRISGSAFSYYAGIHELRIRAPAGTEIFAHGTFAGWDPGGTVIFHIWESYKNGTHVDQTVLTYLTEQTCLDPFGQYVITVASYDDVGGNIVFPTMVNSAPHDIADDSSRGPLRDFSDPAAPVPVLVKPDIAAPGVKINSALAVDTQHLGFKWPWWYWGDRFKEESGTSMATPAVAGLLALMLQKNPNLNATQAKALLNANSRPGVNPGTAPASTNAYGAGMIDGMPSHVNTP